MADDSNEGDAGDGAFVLSSNSSLCSSKGMRPSLVLRLRFHLGNKNTAPRTTKTSPATLPIAIPTTEKIGGVFVTSESFFRGVAVLSVGKTEGMFAVEGPVAVALSESYGIDLVAGYGDLVLGLADSARAGDIDVVERGVSGACHPRTNARC